MEDSSLRDKSLIEFRNQRIYAVPEKLEHFPQPARAIERGHVEILALHWHRRRELKVELAPEALQITAPMVRDLCGFTAPASAGTNAARFLSESTCLFRGGLPSCKNFQLASREIGAQWGMLNRRLFDPLVLGNTIGSNSLISNVGGMKFSQLLPAGWRSIWITPLLLRVERL